MNNDTRGAPPEFGPDDPANPYPFQDLRRFSLPAGFRGRSAVVVQLWWIVQAVLFHASPQVFFGWRRMLLRLFGAKVGPGVLLRPSVSVTYPWNVTIGENAWIGDDVTLYSLAPITIGRCAVVSQKSYLCTGSHDPERMAFDILGEPITIGDEAWVAADCFVMPGVSIGRAAVVSARSLVRSDVEAGAIVAGSPARFMRWRKRPEAA